MIGNILSYLGMLMLGVEEVVGRRVGRDVVVQTETKTETESRAFRSFLSHYHLSRWIR